MGKKSKKRQSRKSRSTTSEARVNNLSSGPSVTAASSSEFKPDYSQTIKDLKRIGILAGTFFVILLGLSFFLG